MIAFANGTRVGIWLIAALGLAACERQRPEPKVPPARSRLQAATDVFWALQELGYVVAKEKPQASQHGCKPFELLAQQAQAPAAQAADGQAAALAVDPNGARFRISVFECPTAEKAAEIVEHPHTRHVDALLRDRHEGGVLQRRALEIIVRKEHGSPQAADRLMESLAGM